MAGPASSYGLAHHHHLFTLRGCLLPRIGYERIEIARELK
ncbi:hypothetical protein LINPERHAP1_LOCUS32697 [Linum perenne]